MSQIAEPSLCDGAKSANTPDVPTPLSALLRAVRQLAASALD